MDTISGSPDYPHTQYHEQKIGKTLYRITSVYKGEVDLANALEDLTARRIIKGMEAAREEDA